MSFLFLNFLFTQLIEVVPILNYGNLLGHYISAPSALCGATLTSTTHVLNAVHNSYVNSLKPSSSTELKGTFCSHDNVSNPAS